MLCSTFLLVLSTSLFLLTIIKWGIYNKTKRPKLPPGPIPWPIVGNLPELCRNRPAFLWIQSIMQKLATDIACIRLGNVHVMVVKSPELAREFLVKNDNVFQSRPVTMATEYVSRGFLGVAVSPWGPQWKKIRKIWNTEFMSPARLRWLLEKRNQEADFLVYYIYNQCNNSSKDGSLVNLRFAVRHYSVNVLRRILFNKRYFGKGGGDEEQEHLSAIFTILRYMYGFSISDYLPWCRMMDVDGHQKIIKDAMKVLNKFHDPIIEERVEQWRDGKKQESEDLLDVMISLKDEWGRPLLSIEEIKAQCTEFFIGSDSPPTAVEWVMAEMINQPQIHQKAMEEIDSVVGRERLVQESDIPLLNYVKACLREAMRLHPVVPFNPPRMSIAETTIGAYFIPKGSHFLLDRRGLGRNPNVWEEPLEFKPERHLNNNMASKVDLTEPELRFGSFSVGKRSCPGIALGTTLCVMALCRLLQGFTWSLPQNEKSIDLSELPDKFFHGKPLHVHAKPRLSVTVYPFQT